MYVVFVVFLIVQHEGNRLTSYAAERIGRAARARDTGNGALRRRRARLDARALVAAYARRRRAADGRGDANALLTLTCKPEFSYESRVMRTAPTAAAANRNRD